MLLLLKQIISEWTSQETSAYKKAREEKKHLLKNLEVVDSIKDPIPQASIVKNTGSLAESSSS